MAQSSLSVEVELSPRQSGRETRRRRRRLWGGIQDSCRGVTGGVVEVAAVRIYLAGR